MFEKDKYKKERKPITRAILRADRNRNAEEYWRLIEYSEKHYPTPAWKIIINAILGCVGMGLYLFLFAIACTYQN